LPVGTQAKAMVQVNGSGAPQLYALGMDNKLYQVKNNSLFFVPVPLTADTKVLDIASNGSQLVLLTVQPMKAGASTSNNIYTLDLLSPDQAKPDHHVFDTFYQI